MSKMTDEQIKKGLEVCSMTNMTLECKNCPYDTFNARNCSIKLCEDALDLINRQQSEIERLQEDSKRLKKVQMQLDDAMKMYSTIKAEVIKEYKEKLRDLSSESDLYDRDGRWVQAVTLDEIDETYKEMVGEDK